MFVRILASTGMAVVLAAWTPRPATAPAVTFSAKMTGASETPPTGVKGTGTAKFSLSGNTLSYSIEVKDLTGPPTAAHIHVGAVGVAGPPVYTFTLQVIKPTGTIAKGAIDLSKPASAGVSGDSLRVLLNNGNAYVNVHTAAHTGGEIRGQIVKP